MTSSPLDPVAGALLDFQSVMAQFLELQSDIISALAARELRAGGAPPASVPAADRTAAPSPVAEPVPVAAAPAQADPARATDVEQGLVDVDRAAYARYTPAVRECAFGDARAGIAADHAVVVTDDGRGVASVVAERLRREGRRVAMVAARASPGLNHDLFVSSLDSSSEAERVARSIRQACGPVAALIHLAPLSAAPPFDTWDAALWWSRLSCETRALFLLAQSLGPSLDHAARNGGAACVAATSMGGAFGTGAGNRLMYPSQGGVIGFLKSLAIEWPDVRVRGVDLDPAESVEAQAAHLIEELWSPDPHHEVGHFNGRRVSVEVVRNPAVPDPSFVVPGDAVILATGGARGITAEVCLELAERYHPTFVLVGQSPLPPVADPPDVAALRDGAEIKRALNARLRGGGSRPTPAIVEKAYRQLVKEREIRGTLSRLSAAGAPTQYVQLDVADAPAFGALIDDVYTTYGRLDGVIHGAGIIEDRLVRDKTEESFDRVLRTKAVSAFVLSRHLKPESLRFAVFFSSVAGRFGNRGQADYAAANEVVSKLAVVLQHRWPVRVCSIAWAPWDKLGMVSAELKREFARRGVELLAPAAGRRALWQEIQQPAGSGAEVVVGGRAAGPLAMEPPRTTLPLLQHARRVSEGRVMRFVRRLDPSVDRYLHHHCLDGRPVLPLAFATELMAEAAQAAYPDLSVVAVRDLQLLKGIVVDPTAVEVVLTVHGPVHDSEDGSTEVDVHLSTPDQTPPARYRSVVRLASRDREPPVFDLPAPALVPLGRSVSAAYREWTFHGPLFQTITRIAGIGADSIVGTVHSASASGALVGVERPSWIIDPFVFDGALQLLLMWSRARNDRTALPSRFGTFRRHAPLSDVPLTCHVAVESLASGHALRSDVHFVDGSGRTLAVLEAMEASCSTALNRLAGADAPAEGRP
jgi:NAD(P)-dependent dehydrogenase (short-subunit alcohol dehydrogenase family)